MRVMFLCVIWAFHGHLTRRSVHLLTMDRRVLARVCTKSDPVHIALRSFSLRHWMAMMHTRLIFGRSRLQWPPCLWTYTAKSKRQRHATGKMSCGLASRSMCTGAGRYSTQSTVTLASQPIYFLCLGCRAQHRNGPKPHNFSRRSHNSLLRVLSRTAVSVIDSCCFRHFLKRTLVSLHS